MRVVVSGYVGKKITGIGRNLIELLSYTDKNNTYIVYVNEDMKDEFANMESNVIVKTYSVSKNSSMGNLLWTSFVFPLIALKKKANVALIPNFTFLLFKFKPTVVIMHDLIEFNVSNKFSPLKMFYRTKIADPITAKHATKLITVSNNSKSDIEKYLSVPSDKISVVFNGVDKEKFYPDTDECAKKKLAELGVTNDYLLYVGTVDHPGKNALGVIRAFEVLRQDNSFKGSLVIAGMPGAGYEVVSDYIEQSKYSSDIILLGYVTDDELRILYSGTACFCFLSLYEGFGIPPLEALACGAKVLVSNTSSLPEVVGSIGVTTNPSDLSDIVEELRIVLKEEKRPFSEYLSHLRYYDWAVLSTRFESVLKDSF